MTNEVMANKNNEVTYEAGGQEVTLSINEVEQFITKGNAKITESEAYNFIQLCKYSELNPFLNEAYLVKFGQQPAQMIVSKEAYMKRANRNPNFNGFKAGVVVMRNNEIFHKEGQTIYPNEQLIGGWARVYRKDIENDFYQEVSLQEYGKGQATWKQMPANMIRKNALVGALREAFPEDLGGMYTEDEPGFDEEGQLTDTVEDDGVSSQLVGVFKKKQPEADKEQSKEDDNTIDADFEEIDDDKPEDSKEIDWTKYTDEQIKKSLDKKGAAYQEDAKRDELIAVAEMVINGGVIQDELL